MKRKDGWGQDEFEPMPVQRIQTDNGSHVEPPLDQSWSKLDKLRWHAGVVEVDCGVRVYISPGALTTPRIFGPDRIHWDRYALRIGNSSLSALDYPAAWDYLNGVEAGATAVRQEVAA